VMQEWKEKMVLTSKQKLVVEEGVEMEGNLRSKSWEGGIPCVRIGF
jgi:hypothetical protein